MRTRRARNVTRATTRKPRPKAASFSMRAFRGILESLASGIRGLDWDPPQSVWTDYYSDAGSYSQEGTEHKRMLVSKLIDEVGPSTRLGSRRQRRAHSRVSRPRKASRPFASRSIPAASSRRTATESSARATPNFLPLLKTSPTPARGSAGQNTERFSLADRGPADLAMALAVVHHLAIGNNVPLERVAGSSPSSAAP